jgi:hypothetical protein
MRCATNHLGHLALSLGLHDAFATSCRSTPWYRQLGEERNGSGDRCTMGSPPTGGSINEVGWRFQSFEINDLELVDQNSASWNPLLSWLRQLEALRRAA